MSDIRKWFMKTHDKGNGNSAKPAAAPKSPAGKPSTVAPLQPEESGGHETAARRKTSKYFDKDSEKLKGGNEERETPAKRKTEKPAHDSHENIKPPPTKKVHKAEEEEDDDFASISVRKKSSDVTPSKKLKCSSGVGSQKNVDAEESDEEIADEKESDTPAKSVGRGRGGRAGSNAAAAVSGRGRGGGGRGGFMNFGERKEPPHKGEKEVPEGTPECLAGMTFVISGTLDSLEREEAEDLIKRHGGRVTAAVSKKTSYLLCDEDIGGRKSAKARELGTPFLTEDGLFDMIRASKTSKTSSQDNRKKPPQNVSTSTPKKAHNNVEVKKDNGGDLSTKNKASRSSLGASPAKKKDFSKEGAALPWTEKYRPKIPNDIVGNQSIVKNLHNWLSDWEELFLHNKVKEKKQYHSKNDFIDKKVVLMCGSPGIGKTTSAKLVSKMLGYEAIEVNASDNRGKADSQIGKGIGGSTANSVKELISNESLGGNLDRSKHRKTVLIMDEVDGMSAGDRGGVQDLISSIKISKIPIICICNDRWSQKLKSLVGHCAVLDFRKPTKQQIAKRLMQIANAERLQAREIAMEELAERCNGDIRMAVNQLQYMSLSISAIGYDDVKQRLLSSSKDEDISPFKAVEKLFNFNAGKLRMDERIDLSMSDLDLVPLIIQCLIDAWTEGNIVEGVYLSQARACQARSLARELAFGLSFLLLLVFQLITTYREICRGTFRLDYATLVAKQLTEPLRVLPKDDAVKNVVDFMNAYSLSMEDYDTVMELSKFQGRPSLLNGVPPAVKAALTKAYNEGSSSRVVRTADLITLPGMKKRPKKRIAAILEPVDELNEANEDLDGEDEEESPEDEEELEIGEKKPKLDLQTDPSKGIQVQVDLKSNGKPSSKSKTTQKGAGRGKRGSAETASGKRGGRGGSGAGAKRKSFLGLGMISCTRSEWMNECSSH
ncbi:hypothetical protein Cgig2_022757 [Carnegiea gigantea]|uniref:Replication factor C subunit 1 n=1 Tax=Carnegiea gigantea TaxID=171969 RepID=A0A9Q1KDJ9_9CARY|nr:hypothetical protein Cgig2_022757 [Carnegiea gigantea]